MRMRFRSFPGILDLSLAGLTALAFATLAQAVRPGLAEASVPAPLPAATPAVTIPGAVPVHVAGIRMVGPDQVLLLLADEKEERAVPMTVGRDQGIAIYLGKERAKIPRPLTHDLLVQILKALGASVEKVTVTELKEDTYYAVITLRSGKSLHQIDARPSDAIALAVRLDAPIEAAAGLLRSIQAPPGPGAIATRGDHRLGLSVQALDADLAESLGAGGVTGVLVASVRTGGPAAGAGLRRGDIVLAIDEKTTSDLESYGKAAAAAGDPPRFRIWRDGERKTLVRP